jgi:hypothetical protein
MSESLAIGRFVTRCRAPRRLGWDAALLDRVSSGPFLRACARELDGLHDAGLCRIRQLAVRVLVAPGDLSEDRLATLWAAAFARALREALTRSGAPGRARPEIVRAESRAAWLARWIADLIAGTAGSRWEYAEFRALEGQGAAAALAALLAEPGEIEGVLLLLARRRLLETFLRLFNDAALEQLIAAISTAAGAEESASAVGDLVVVARACAAGMTALARGRLTDRSVALKLFVLLRWEAPRTAPATPRRVLHALNALGALLDLTAHHGAGLDVLARLDGRVEAWVGRPAHPAVACILAALRALVVRFAAGHPPRALADLAEAIEQLRPLAPAPGTQGERWVSSDVAGLFLLVGSLERLDWPRRWLAGPLGAQHGPRAVSYLLGGLALALVGRFSEAIGPLDPGVAIFAGFFGEPDLGGMRRFFAAPLPGGLAEARAVSASAQTWAGELETLADLLVRTFAVRIRGFRDASRAFLVSRLIATPGRVRIEDHRIQVRLAPNPLHIALHVSGIDYAVGPLAWYGGRSVDLELEGL